jgi:hypothetical protein
MAIFDSSENFNESGLKASTAVRQKDVPKIPWGPDTRITVLARPSRNLLVFTGNGMTLSGHVEEGTKVDKKCIN